MTQQMRKGITRREFMQRALITSLGAGGMGAFWASCAPPAVEPAPTPEEELPFAGVGIAATYMQAGTYDTAAEEIAPAFETETGMEVELVAAPWAVLNQMHITDLTTQTGEFDVISGEWWIASVFQHMLALDEYVERDNFGTDYVPTLFQPGPSNFYEGQRIGVPYSADAYGILYRTDLFEEAGIDAEWENWDDLFERADVLRETLPGDIAPIAFAFGAPEQTPSIFLGAYPGTLVSADNQYRVEREPALQALDVVLRTVEYGPSDALGLSIDEANAVFLQGNAAMLIGWPSFVRAAANDPDQSNVVGQWRLANYPGPGFPFLSCWNLFISRYSEHPDAAWEWIKAYANPENGKRFMVDYGIGSPFQSTYEDEELLEGHAHDFPQQMANLARSKTVPWIFEAFEIMFRNLGEMVTGAMTPEETIDRWHEAWDDVVVPAGLIETADAQGLKAN